MSQTPAQENQSLSFSSSDGRPPQLDSTPNSGGLNFISCWLGSQAYAESLRFMDRESQTVRGTPQVVVLGQEHPLVITLGVRGQSSQDLVDAEGVPVHLTRRGGQATLHNLGQLVIYPIVDLRELTARSKNLSGIRDFVQLLKAVTQATLWDLGLRDLRERLDEPGIYTARGKIAFFGLQVSSGVTRHGLSINVSNSLSDFGRIRSCGITSESFDKVAQYLPDATPKLVFELWNRHFKSALEKDSLDLPDLLP